MKTIMTKAASFESNFLGVELDGNSQVLQPDPSFLARFGY